MNICWHKEINSYNPIHIWRQSNELGVITSVHILLFQIGSSLIWVYAVCPDLSVRKLRIIMVSILCPPCLHLCHTSTWLPIHPDLLDYPVRKRRKHTSRRMTKPRKWPVHTANTQISLGICPVWSVFAVRMKKYWALNYLLSTHWRHWSDWADAQADLRLHLAHIILLVRHAAAHIQ